MNNHKLFNKPKGYQWIQKLSTLAFINFARTKDLADSKHSQFVAQNEISQGKLNLLIILYHAGEKGLKPSEISECMLVSRAGITGLIERMKKEGLVEREEHPSDRRSCIVYITEKGKQFYNRFLPKEEEFIERTLQGFSDDELKLLIDLMTKIQRNLEGV